jgi:hypothetical protein
MLIWIDLSHLDNYFLAVFKVLTHTWSNSIIYNTTVGFEVFTTANMKMAVYRVVAPCSLVEVYQRFRGTCCFHHQGGNGGRKCLWNVGKLLPDYTALQPRRHPSSNTQLSCKFYKCTNNNVISELLTELLRTHFKYSGTSRFEFPVGDGLSWRRLSFSCSFT